MPKKQRGATYPNYTKVFSNLASIFAEINFIKDEWNPFDELTSMKANKSSRHIINDFEYGLHDIKQAKYEMK